MLICYRRGIPVSISLHTPVPKVGTGRKRHQDSSLLKDAAIVTPVCQQFWKDELATHHDPDFVGWVLRGLQEGFRIGFDDTIVDLSSAHSNMSSPGGGVSVHSEGGIGGTPATNRPIRRCLALQDSYQPAGSYP